MADTKHFSDPPLGSDSSCSRCGRPFLPADCVMVCVDCDDGSRAHSKCETKFVGRLRLRTVLQTCLLVLLTGWLVLWLMGMLMGCAKPEWAALAKSALVVLLLSAYFVPKIIDSRHDIREWTSRIADAEYGTSPER